MSRPLTLVILLSLPLPALADNYATCLLEKLPGLENDPAAYAAVQVCTSKYPAQMATVEPGSGRGFWSYESGAECTLDKAGSTRSRVAAFQIRAACNRLYDELTGDAFWESGIITPPAAQ